MSMDIDTVKRVARLARIELSEARAEELAPQLAGIMQFVEQLGEVNTDNVAPLANVVDIAPHLREDVVNDGDSPKAVLKKAPEEQEGYYVVQKIVE